MVGGSNNNLENISSVENDNKENNSLDVDIKVGMKAPNFSLTDLDGENITLEDF